MKSKGLGPSVEHIGSLASAPKKVALASVPDPLGATEAIGDRIDKDCNRFADEDALGNPSTDTQDHDDDGLPMSNDVIFYDGVGP